MIGLALEKAPNYIFESKIGVTNNVFMYFNVEQLTHIIKPTTKLSFFIVCVRSEANGVTFLFCRIFIRSGVRTSTSTVAPLETCCVLIVRGSCLVNSVPWYQ